MAERLVLHVGCGLKDPAKLHEVFRKDGWKEIRLDINPDVEPDIVGNLIDMKAVDNESMDAVWSSHNLEHLYAHEVPLALAEFQRVLKPDGVLLVTMPNLQEVARHIANGNLEEVLYVSPAGPICPLDILYGFRPNIAAGNHFMAHKTGYIAKTLSEKMQAAGFRNVQVREEGLNLWGAGNK